jgi:hypothetical protein
MPAAAADRMPAPAMTEAMTERTMGTERTTGPMMAGRPTARSDNHRIHPV